MRIIFTAVCVFFVFSAIACSKTDPIIGIQPALDSPDNVESISQSDFQSNYRGVFGAWKVHLDIENLSAEIIPARNASAIGDIYDADLLQFLTISPCSNCLRINSIDLDRLMLLELGLQIKHPFGDLNRRPDLHGFDVRAIIIADWPLLFDYPDIMVMESSGTESPAALSPYFVVNPDGYTSHYRYLIDDDRYFPDSFSIDPANTLNPFIRFFDDPVLTDFDPSAPSGHNVIPVGSDFDTKTVAISLAYSTLTEFYIIADVAYGHSAVLANRTNPQYYLPSFHRTEPWRVEYWIENNNLDNSDTSSTAEMVVQVFDWQHGYDVDPDYPNPDNRSGLPFSSDVLRLELSLSGFQDGLITVDTPESGSGTPTDPLQYRLTITNENGSTGAVGLLAIRDEAHGTSARLPVPEAPSGFPYDTEDIMDYTLYYHVGLNAPFYDGKREEFDNEIYVQSSERMIKNSWQTMYASHFLDQYGMNFNYYWDMDYDGITFDVDGEGLPSPTIPTTPGGIRKMGLGVVTNSVPPQHFIYEIPIYVRGYGFNENISPSSLNAFSTSINRTHSAAIANDYYYLVVSSELAGKRDVILIITDQQGNSESFNVTNGVTGHCFDPSILVVEDGPDAGVYVLYVKTTGGNWEIYSIHGNLDGTGFIPSNEREVAVGGAFFTMRWDNALMIRNNRLFAYWWHFNSGVGGRIKVAYSDDFAQSWTVHGDINPLPAFGTQLNPSFAYLSSTQAIYCVWSDVRNAATNGADLYFAGAWDGLNFGDGDNISSIQGIVDEIYPSVSSGGVNQLAIAYVVDDGVNPHDVRFKLVNPSNYNQIDMDLNCSVGSPIEKHPSIVNVIQEKYLVAFSAQNSFTNELNIIVKEIDISGPFSNFYQHEVFRTSLGTVTADYNSAYPALAATKKLNRDEALEYFCAYRTYSEGSYESTDPATWYYGQIESLQFISDGRSDY